MSMKESFKTKMVFGFGLQGKVMGREHFGQQKSNEL
jgi:hypothetical protein